MVGPRAPTRSGSPRSTTPSSTRSVRRTGVRSAAQPFPDLKSDAASGRVELPLWVLGDGRRETLWVQRRGRRRRPVRGRRGAAGASRRRAVGRRGADAPRGRTIAPKALALTLFVRLFCCDLFIHGVGGGRYDQVTDGVCRALLRSGAAGLRRGVAHDVPAARGASRERGGGFRSARASEPRGAQPRRAARRGAVRVRRSRRSVRATLRPRRRRWLRRSRRPAPTRRRSACGSARSTPSSRSCSTPSRGAATTARLARIAACVDRGLHRPDVPVLPLVARRGRRQGAVTAGSARVAAIPRGGAREIAEHLVAR